MRTARFVYLSLIVVFSVGCSRSNPVVGKYTLENRDRFELELAADGAYVVKELNNVIVRGRYKVSGNTIAFTPDWLTPELGTEKKTETLRIEGSTIVGADNARYIKQGTSQPAPAEASDSRLTQARAQRAIDKFAAGRGRVSVLGVQELPQQNAARVDLTFSNFVWVVDDPFYGGKKQKDWSGPGTATFKHYSDGRWILSDIHIPRAWVMDGPT